MLYSDTMVDLIPAFLLLGACAADVGVLTQARTPRAPRDRGFSPAAVIGALVVLAILPFALAAVLPLDADVSDFYRTWQVPAGIVAVVGAAAAAWHVARGARRAL